MIWRSRKAAGILIKGAAAFFIVLLLLRLWPHEPLSAAVPGSTALLARDGQLLRLTLASDEHYRLWLPLDDISPTLKNAVQVYEDRWFYWHPGVNPVALLRATVATYSGGNRQGASTLTMQLARLKYRLDTRSPAGKLKQIALALWLEARYSKRDILDAYLNLAPYGRNIAGVGAASLIYFGKPAAQLSLPEALTLAVIPQSPSRRAGSGASLAAARARLFTRWQTAYPVSAGEARLMTLPLPARPLAQLPFRAPHFVQQVMAETTPHGPLRTTLDLGLQQVLERQVRQYLAQVGGRGVHNAVALLVDTRDMGVRAMVGSADYFDVAIAGQVNGSDAKRSPGSTLKPFLYGLALDQGLIHPRSMLKDAPTAFGPFQPENFDGRFVGPIAAQDALIRSRNIPAVSLAGRLKRPTLYDFLHDAGVAQMKSEEHYGLALTLGGGEVTMQELAGLYALLPNGGVLRPLRVVESQPNIAGPQLLSPEASFVVLDMLGQNPRPDGLAPARSRGWFTAWKTGTSWGFRDAWTAGVVGPYVLVVWLGNFDGAGNPALVGVETAAPLYFRIADALMLARPNEPQSRRVPPAALRHVAVCADSGDLPNAWCPRTVPTWFIPGRSPIRVSTLHQPVVIDNASGKPACPPYDPARTHTEIFEFWESDMARLFREAGMPRRAPPRAECDGKLAVADYPPRITSPLTNVAYTLRLSRPEETIALQAVAAGDAKTLFWFDNQALLGQTDARGSGLPWRPMGGGWHQLTVVDDQGRSASRQLQVEMQP
ncbi:Penicillin-binding protein 1C [Andreprevotia sp. IGB-42]|uniref:penicillin-binding protein 1C n=1 Tax=Andreprevotia sp. IGB-42 TaxID=2497473 RepID=UPI00157EEED5|nr:penicillin-binding protein 1C [Andreprevotia sp. IGB-42]KAF0814538.1 Penicillin-binding protein 1C [Andreprevotia sp. IGB-42]